MPYEIHPGGPDGQPTAAGPANLTSGFDGTNTIGWDVAYGTVNGVFDGAAVQLRGTPLGADGNYLIVERLGNTLARVRPTPPNNGGVVTGTILPFRGNETFDRIRFGSVSSFVAPDIINGTNTGRRVQVGDKIVISGGVNQGVYQITERFSNDSVRVNDPITGGAGGGAQFATYIGRSELHVIDEVDGTLQAANNNTTIFQPNWGIQQDYMERRGLRNAATGTGTIRFDGIEEAWDFTALSVIRLRNTDDVTDVKLTAKDAAWVNLWAKQTVIRLAHEGDPTTTHTFQFGDITSDDDPIGAREGCLLMGVGPGVPRPVGGLTEQDNDGRMRILSYNTDWKWGDDTFFHIYAMPDGSRAYGSFFNGGGVQCPSDVDTAVALDSKIIECNFVGKEALRVTATGVVTGSLVFRNAETALFNEVTGQLNDIDVSDDTVSPLFQPNLGGFLSFLDPRNSPALSRLAGLGSGFDPGSSELRYSFTPTFVFGEAPPIPGIGIGTFPVEGLTVRLFELNLVTGPPAVEIPGSPFTTDALGQIPTQQLRYEADEAGGGLYLNYSTIMLVVNPSGETNDYWIEFVQDVPFDGVIPVPKKEPDPGGGGVTIGQIEAVVQEQFLQATVEPLGIEAVVTPGDVTAEVTDGSVEAEVDDGSVDVEVDDGGVST